MKADTATYDRSAMTTFLVQGNSQVLMEVDSGRADAAVIDEVFVRY